MDISSLQYNNISVNLPGKLMHDHVIYTQCHRFYTTAYSCSYSNLQTNLLEPEQVPEEGKSYL